MDDHQLQELYFGLFKQYFPNKKRYDLKAQFYTSKSLRHTIEIKSNVIHVRIANHFVSVPREILSVLGLILLGKLFRYKIDRALTRTYRAYVEKHIMPYRERKASKPSPRYTANGSVYDLDEMFDRLNRIYFDAKLKKPLLGWSLNKSYTRLGFYSEERSLLVVSRIFDSRKTPEEVVQFLLYHEMLHILIPVTKKKGYRRIHPPEFRRLEKAFPDFASIQKWIDKNRIKL